MSRVKGVYLLIISIAKSIQIRVGALGSISFAKGIYVYVGSAQNNLEKRVERHLKKAKRKFWHIDYLLENENVKILQVFYKATGKSDECKLAKEISRKGIPIIGFGSSDCNCKSHLFQLNDYQSLKERTHSMKVWLAERILCLQMVGVSGLQGFRAAASLSPLRLC